jgi:hypothetical protein
MKTVFSATALLSGLAACIASVSLPATAATDITLIIGPLNRSISVASIRELAETGKAEGDLRTALRISKQTPEQAGKFLKQDYPFGLVQADKLLRSPIGEGILGRMGKVIAPRVSNEKGAIALRAAILLSLSDDGKLSFLELLDKYPTEMRVNIDELMKASKEFKDLPGLLQGMGR